MASYIPNIHLGIYNNYQNFRPLIFYGDTRLRGSGQICPAPGEIGLKERQNIAFVNRCLHRYMVYNTFYETVASHIHARDCIASQF